MIFRLLGLVVTLGIVGYLMSSFFSSNSKIDKAINANPTVQEQQQALKSVGVDATDKEALRKYTEQQAKQLQEYQNQAPPQ